MDLRYLRLTVTLLFLERIWSLPVGCQYNGTAHGEGETVRMEEPCLSCVCQGGALECSLRVCADQPNALPPGCFFLHKPNECCPQLFCDESFSPTGVELRTGMKLENKLNGNDCWINGSRYAEGSAVASPRVCEYCYCVEGETRCLKPRCLQAFQGCRAVHEKSSCCPTHYDCRDADVDLLTAQIESFALANVDTKNDSSTALPNLNVENEGTHLNDSKSDENASEEEEKAREEVGTTTTTEAATTEETTAPPDEEATPAADDSGLQTMKTEYSTKEATPAGTTEGTTQAPEATTDAPPSVEGESATASDAQNGVDFPEATDAPGAAPNASLGGLQPEADDYEAYDYGEPRLPPSLPNLVIFPFVAADAVVKDDASGFDSRDRMEIKRIDAHPVFYKDYFSPPAKTEGGFVPKEPFYDQAYFREDQVEPPGSDPKAVPPCQDVACPLPQFDERWTKVTSSATGGIAGDLENGEPPFVQELRPGIEETPTDYIFRDESPPFQKSQQAKKPVTVTYKNVVVDFYPNYLVTTTRARPGVGSPVETRPLADEVQVDSPETPAETKFAFPQNFALATSPKTTRETPASTAEPSLFDEFFKSFLSDDIITTTPSAKHKYSSKIKGNANAVQDVAGQKAKPEIAEATTWTDSPSNSLFGTEDSTVPFSTTKSEVGKQVKKNGTKSLTKSTTPATWTQEGAGRGPSEADAGALLKLAGCNIYGMMYRVGKLITELSGPCLECLCTDLGVQCRPLAC